MSIPLRPRLAFEACWILMLRFHLSSPEPAPHLIRRLPQKRHSQLPTILYILEVSRMPRRTPSILALEQVLVAVTILQSISLVVTFRTTSVSYPKEIPREARSSPGARWEMHSEAMIFRFPGTAADIALSGIDLVTSPTPQRIDSALGVGRQHCHLTIPK